MIILAYVYVHVYPLIQNEIEQHSPNFSYLNSLFVEPFLIKGWGHFLY